MFNCITADHARFVCFSSDWATTIGRLLGPATCLLHEDGGIPLSALSSQCNATRGEMMRRNWQKTSLREDKSGTCYLLKLNMRLAILVSQYYQF